MFIKVAITDDHPMVVNGIKNMLYYYKHVEIQSTYSTGLDLLEGLKIALPDILLLDIQLPDKNGNELARIITKEYPAVRIIVLTSLDSVFHIKDMMHVGCKGYMLKTATKEMLLEAIEQVFGGGEYIDPGLKDRLVQQMLHMKPQNDLPSALTRREKEILQLIAAEHTSSEIAEQLCLSQRTVENHRFSLLQKLQAKNTVGLLKAALQMGLLQ